MSRLKRVKTLVANKFAEAGSGSTFREYVHLLYGHFVEALAAGQSFHFLDSLVEWFSDINTFVDRKVHHGILNVAGVTVSDQLAESQAFLHTLKGTTLAIEELQLRHLEGDLEWAYKNRKLRFQLRGL